MRARAASCLLLLLACRASNSAFQLESSSSGARPHNDRTTGGEATGSTEGQSGTANGSREAEAESADSSVTADGSNELNTREGSSTETEDDGGHDSSEQTTTATGSEDETNGSADASDTSGASEETGSTTTLDDDTTDTESDSQDTTGEASTTGIDPESSFCDAQDLVACYRFRRVMDGIVKDEGPYANHLSVSGAVITEDDEFGPGLNFSREAFVWADDDPSFALNDGFTVEVWLRFNNAAAGRRADIFDVDGLDILFQSTETLRLACGTYQSAGLSLSSVPLGTYVYLSCSVSRDHDVVVQIGDTSNFGSLRSMPKVEGRDIVIGRDLEAHVLALRVWSRPLGDEERCGQPRPSDCAHTH